MMASNYIRDIACGPPATVKNVNDEEIMSASRAGTDLSAIKSAKRVLEIFEFFAQRRKPAGIGEIASALGYPQSSTSVMMRCLHELRYMQHDPVSRVYRPTLRLALTSSWLREQHFSGEELTQLMTELRDKTGGSVVLGIQSDVDLQYIQVVPSRLPVQLVMRIGQIRPLCRTAVGKALLARQSDQVISGIVRRLNARDDGERIVAKTLLAEIAEVRRTNLSYSANAASQGAAVIAALIPVAEGELPMALGIGGPLELINSNRAMIETSLLTALRLG
jgi:DNA-binding IclR family transcriptional regulator